MQDVISAGGEGVGQRRAAEVEVVIDNSEGRAATEFSEIAIQRRLDRSGEGDYRLNGARCRLVDVVEVLSDTNLGREMHSVISQGRVESIVHSKPRERRLLIEEAAGLGKHRKRRRRAELKLSAARDNLDRALDVEREARSRLRPLKRQAQAAELGARIEREELGCARRSSPRSCASARTGSRRPRGARPRRARRATRSRRELAEVSERRRAAEERFAERDRERTRAWGRADQPARRPRADRRPRRAARRPRAPSSRPRLEALRAELGPLTLDVDGGSAARRASAPASWRRSWARSTPASPPRATASSGPAPRRRGRPRRRAWPRSAPAPSAPPATRAGPRACWASATARRLERRIAGREELLAASARARAAAIAVARRGPARASRRPRRRVVGGEGDGDAIAEEMRACSRRESELQAQIKAASDELHRGRGRGRPPRRPPRRGGQGAGARSPPRLGEEIEPAEQPLDRRGARGDRSPARAPRAPPRADRPGQPARRARVRGGARARRRAPGPARGHRAGDARAGVADPRHRP